VSGELGQQVVCLALQVVFLLGRGHSGVDNLLFLDGLSAAPVSVGEPVQSDAPGRPLELHFPGLGPSPQRLRVHLEELGVLGRFDIHECSFAAGWLFKPVCAAWTYKVLFCNGAPL